MNQTTQDVNHLFFSPTIFVEDISEEDYVAVQASIDILDALSRMCSLSIYVLDHYKKNFLYISPNHLLLQGLTIKEMKEMGFLSFERFTTPQEYLFLQKMHKETFCFFYDLPAQDRLKYTLCYNFRMKMGCNKSILVNHTTTPIRLDLNGQVWLSMCVVEFAPRRSIQDIEIKNSDNSERLIFDRKSLKWIKKPPIVLTEKEILILRLSMQGFSNLEIGDHIHLDTNTIKFHKKSIFSKLNASNIQEAITYAINNKLI